jgi:thioredoxin 1
MFFKKKPPVEVPIVHAFDDDFDTLVASEPGVTLVDFWAPWCGPCRMMGPILDEIAVEHQDRGVRVMKVNTDQARETAARFEIRSIPTLIFFRDGEPQFEMVGLVSKPVLEREIDGLLASPPG